MSLPEPHPGLVISYAHLWSSEHERGLREGGKDRVIFYGVLRPAFFRRLCDRLLNVARDRRLRSVARSD